MLNVPSGGHRRTSGERKTGDIGAVRILVLCDDEPFYLASTLERMIGERPPWMQFAGVAVLVFSPVGTRGGTIARSWSLARVYGFATVLLAGSRMVVTRFKRGARLSSVLDRLNVPLHRIDNTDVNRIEPVLETTRPDVVLTIGLNRLVPRHLVGQAGRHWINVHPGDLERHRGCAPVFWALHDSDTEVAVSVHTITDRVDGGLLLAKRTVPVVERRLSAVLRDLRAITGEAVHEAVERLRRNDVSATAPGKLPRLRPAPSRADVRRFRSRGNRLI